ncbi:MAG: hypothetical protein AB7G65_19640 [Thermoleophilia bacterium]
MRDLLGDAGLGPPAEPYSALAFARPAALPDEAPAAGEPLPVAFAIANAEGTDRLYAWRITVDAGDGPEVVARGRASVGDGATEMISTRVPVACAGERVRLGVVLDAPTRRIGTWLACPGVTP